MMGLSTSLVFSFNQVTRGEIVSFFREVRIPSDTVVNDDVVSLFGDVLIQGNVKGDVITIFGKARIEGEVEGDVVSILGGITVASMGRINGGAIAILGHGIDNNGLIRQEEYSILGFAPSGWSASSMLFFLFLILTFFKQLLAFGMSLIAVLLFNDRFDRMAFGANEDTGKKLLVGLLVYFGSFIGVAILVMTVIGAPLILLLLPAILLLGFLGNTTIKVALGRKIALHFNKKWNIVMELLTGALIFGLLEVTLIGNLITFALKFIGIGELIDSHFGERKKI